MKKILIGVKKNIHKNKEPATGAGALLVLYKLKGVMKHGKREPATVGKRDEADCRSIRAGLRSCAA